MTGGPLILATLDGFAVEGGFDVAYGPSTSYGAASGLGQCATPGVAANLWNDYEEVLNLVPQLGLDGIRLTIEWARLEPRPTERDQSAFDRYGDVIRHAKSLGLHVTAVAVDAIWPSWLGPDAWLMPWVAPMFTSHVETVVAQFGERLDGLVLFARHEQMIRDGFIRASAPPWRRRASADAASALKNLNEMVGALGARTDVAKLLVTSYREVPVVADANALTALIRDAASADQIHLRSLVRGFGPTASPSDLLEFVEGSWTIRDESLRASWR